MGWRGQRKNNIKAQLTLSPLLFLCTLFLISFCIRGWWDRDGCKWKGIGFLERILSGLKPFSAFVPAGYGSRRDLVDGELTHHDKVYAQMSPLLLSRTKGVCVRSFDVRFGPRP
ncbi:hypothetical protein F2Q69_00063856 [Brassica cretica]|uniref:Uncharacterized protein n=1 Tax=Brassica cretica TaxID=69181 RepID=A0A8S9RM14_BRACR|nr:hypothetical protein F2Q69_00063856 [Brassica cretica]